MNVYKVIITNIKRKLGRIVQTTTNYFNKFSNFNVL